MKSKTGDSLFTHGPGIRPRDIVQYLKAAVDNDSRSERWLNSMTIHQIIGVRDRNDEMLGDPMRGITCPISVITEADTSLKPGLYIISNTHSWEESAALKVYPAVTVILLIREDKTPLWVGQVLITYRPEIPRDYSINIKHGVYFTFVAALG